MSGGGFSTRHIHGGWRWGIVALGGNVTLLIAKAVCNASNTSGLPSFCAGGIASDTAMGYLKVTVVFTLSCFSTMLGHASSCRSSFQASKHSFLEQIPGKFKFQHF